MADTHYTDLFHIRDRFKALSSDILWLAGGEGTEADSEETRQEVYALGKAVDAAVEKRRAQTFGKSEKDEDLYKLLDGVIGTVEADSYAQHMLWCEYAEEATKFGFKESGVRFSWKQENFGLGRQCGVIEDMPVMISLSINIVGGHRILFYHGMSQVVDHEMIRAWLKANLPVTAFCDDRRYINNTDATNFCNIINSASRTLEAA